MKTTLKTIISLLLVLSMLFVFIACDEETESDKNGGSADTGESSGDNGTGDGSDDKGTGDTTPDDGGSTDKPGENANVLEVLTAALAKTKSAKSFVLKYGDIAECAEMDMYNENLCVQSVVIHEDGSYTSLAETPDGCLAYYNGNEGYEVDTYRYPEIYAHKISDKPFGADRVFSELGLITNKNFLADFCALNPSASTKDGITEYKVAPLTVEQLLELMMGAKLEEGDVDVDEEMYEAITSTEMIVKITSDGYISEISAVMIMSGEIEGQLVSASSSMVLRISDFNEELMIEAPEWSETFYEYPDRGYQVRYCYDNYDMVYECDSFHIANRTYTFKGIEIFTSGETDEFDEEIIIPVYKVQSEINGTPVDFVRDICPNTWVENVYIQCIVIPDGVNFGDENYNSNRVWSDTTLFFERAREDEDAHRFVIVGSDCGDEYCYTDHMQVKAAYYEGEWEYIDGVPTPKA